MRYMNSESANLLTGQGKFSQRTQSKQHRGLIKELIFDTINCALAHWYFLPGLDLQRYRLRLAFSLIRTPDAARRAFSTLPATLYLASDFALKSLRTQPRVGSYLDVSSPWLFPFYVLKAFKPDRALLLNASGTTRNLFKHLASATEANATEVLTKELGHLSGLAESFDTITCLAGLSPEEKESELLGQMWKALSPGGTLILSVVCSRAESQSHTDSDAHGAVDHDSTRSAARSYDSDLLESRILGVLGEPRSYAIYGEEAAGHINHSPAEFVPQVIASWRESVTVGKYWRRYSSMSQVRGRGLVAMKFMKPTGLSAARKVS
jgi:hypothetical protein